MNCCQGFRVHLVHGAFAAMQPLGCPFQTRCLHRRSWRNSEDGESRPADLLLLCTGALCVGIPGNVAVRHPQPAAEPELVLWETCTGHPRIAG